MTVLPDVGLTPWERVHLHCHTDIDQCCDTWPAALLDAGCRGFPTAVMQPSSGGGSHSSSVESAVISETGVRPDFASAWIAELGDVIGLFGLSSRPAGVGVWDGGTARGPWHAAADGLLEGWPPHAELATKRLSVLANLSRSHWPSRPGRGQVVDGVRVNERGTGVDVEVCGLCGLAAPSGRDGEGRLLVRRIDGVAYHNLAVGGMPACFWAVWRQRRAS